MIVVVDKRANNKRGDAFGSLVMGQPGARRAAYRKDGSDGTAMDRIQLLALTKREKHTTDPVAKDAVAVDK